MRILLGMLLLLLPLIYVLIMYCEGGLLGVGLYGMYVLATLVSIHAPILGYKLLKGLKL